MIDVIKDKTFRPNTLFPSALLRLTLYIGWPFCIVSVVSFIIINYYYIIFLTKCFLLDIRIELKMNIIFALSNCQYVWPKYRHYNCIYNKINRQHFEVSKYIENCLSQKLNKMYCVHYSKLRRANSFFILSLSKRNRLR